MCAKTLLAIGCLMLNPVLVAQLEAADGKLEINQTCAAAGCFPGDDPGFPVDIAASGSYLLTGNLAPADKDGIHINAHHVTLDLNGFEIVGDDSTFNKVGIGISQNMTNTEVSNGTVRDFGSAGVTCFAAGCHQARFTGLRVLSNGEVGIALGGVNAVVVRDCVVEDNEFGGIFLSGDAVTVSDCTVRNNTLDSGIRAGEYALVSGNVLYNNEGHGIHVDQKSTVIGNVVIRSGQHGISFNGGHSLVKNNTVHDSNQSAESFENIETCASCTLVDNELP